MGSVITLPRWLGNCNRGIARLSASWVRISDFCS
jgi:hypothetical protein